MSRSTALARQVCWTEVLTHLQVPIPVAALPAQLTCPLCRAAALWVFPDRLWGGQWLHCRACGFAGDVIELAAQAWTTGIESALLRLHALGVPLPESGTDPAAIAAYVRDHPEYRRQIRAFWQAAQDELAIHHTSETRQLVLRAVGVRHYTLSQWDEQGRRYLGAADRLTAERLFHPGASRYRQQSGRRGHGGGAHRLFRGPGWGMVLVVPFYDLPGRLCGFLFIGREADPAAGDWVYQPVRQGAVNARPKEAGLQMIDGLFAPPHPLLGDESLFVIPDPALALTLQLRALAADTMRPLPIVGSYGDHRAATRAVWTHLPHRRPIFLVARVDESLLAQARQADGWIATPGLTRRSLQGDLMSHRRPHAWLRRARRKARPWCVVLRCHLRTLPLCQAEALLRRLGFDWAELEQFVRQSDEELRQKLRPLLHGRQVTPRVRLGGRTVIETDAGWFWERSGELISDAVVRIEQVLHSARQTRYRGFVRFRGRTYPFCAPAAPLDRHLLAWTRRFLLQAGAGLLTYQATWSRKALALAQQFHPPELVECETQIGWSRPHSRFLFPTFCLTLGGEVERGRVPLDIDPTAPAWQLQPPQRLLPSERQVLSERSAETGVFWAVAAAVIHNVLSWLLHYPPVPLALDGAGAQAMGRIAAGLLGCQEVRLPARERLERALPRLERACAAHHWPVVLVAPRQMPGYVRRACLERPPAGGLMPVSPLAAAVAAINGGWHVLTCHQAAGSLRELAPATAKVLPAYLADAGRRHFQLALGRDQVLRDLLADLAAWFGRCGGARSAVEAAAALLTSEGEPPLWHHLRRLLVRLYDEGHLSLVREAWEPVPRSGLALVQCAAEVPCTADTAPEHAPIWIPQQPLNRLLARHNVPPLDVPRISRALRSAGLLLAEVPRHRETGWVVPGHLLADPTPARTVAAP